MTLDELRDKFPKCNHLPRENCRYCGGSGDKRSIGRSDLPCICIYVDHDICDFAQESLSETVKKMKKEMGL